MKIGSLIKHPKRVILKLLYWIAGCFTDNQYVRLYYRLHMGRRLNLESPTTFNEKLNWLKLNDHNPLYTQLVDKFSVKEYVASKVGNRYVIPTIGVWDTPEEIDWECLPTRFVLKTTHGGGNSGVIICKDKNSIDKQVIIKKLHQSLTQDLYKHSREWPYKNVSKKILAEPYLEDSETKELRDYKFFCFDGEVKFLFVASERQSRPEPYFDFFDANFNILAVKQGHPNSMISPRKPKCFEEMKVIASQLSIGIPHVRIDLYEVDGKVMFGEMTFYNMGGVVPFEPNQWDYIFGDYIKLPVQN